jgi:putative SOS response-associated peptidase YedK
LFFPLRKLLNLSTFVSKLIFMCGRYTLVKSAKEVSERFGVEVGKQYQPRFNAAPTQLMPVITADAPKGLSWFHWGLVPAWSKDKAVSHKLINARAETLEEKASFRNALQRRRCLIPADGFYEWKPLGKKSKVPYRITLLNEELFAFAGLWEEYEDDEGQMVHTFTIITTEANKSLESLHSRMPVILKKEAEGEWLKPDASPEELKALLKPYAASKTRFYTVSSQVNSPATDLPALIQPAPAADQFGNYTLFG